MLQAERKQPPSSEITERVKSYQEKAAIGLTRERMERKLYQSSLLIKPEDMGERPRL